MRFYEKEFPSVGDIVLCQIEEVIDIGSYCSLLEYGGLKGMIGITEYSRLRIRSVSKIVNIGKLVVAQVIAVDIASKCIDLSKKLVSEKEQQTCWEGYERGKKVQTFLQKVVHKLFPTSAEERSKMMMHLYETVIWKLEEPYLTLQIYANGGRSELFQEYEEVCKEIAQKMFKVRAQIVFGVVMMVCYGLEGIEGVKRVLKKAKEAFQVEITYKTAGEFRVEVKTENREEGKKRIHQVMEYIIEESHRLEGGDAKIVEMATVTYEESSSEEE